MTEPEGDQTSENEAAEVVWLDVLAAAARLPTPMNQDDVEEDLHTRYGLTSASMTAGELRAYFNVMGSSATDPESTSGLWFGEPADTDWSRAGWLRVEGGGLDQPVHVRLGIHRGRPRIVGIHVDNAREVTADMLRSIKVGQILRELLDGHQEPATEDDFLWHEWIDKLLEDAPEVAPEDRVARKGQPPRDPALRNFARVYLEALKKDPRRAMTHAAAAVPIARSTAYRWAEQCRERGYLPKDET